MKTEVKKLPKIGITKIKYFHENGEKYVIEALVTLNDDCKNGHHDFSITGEVFRIAKNGRRVWERCGQIPEEIVKHFPELSPFMNLHLSNYLGHPLYAVENGMYYLQKDGEAREYLRITDEENETLRLAAVSKDKMYFRKCLYDLGIVDRWKKEADAFIEYIERESGNVWENPYDEPKISLQPLTKEELEIVAKTDYSKEAIEQREKDRLAKEKTKKLQTLKERYEEKVEKIKKEYEIFKFLVENDFDTDNVIYYDHSKTVAFNWKGFGEKFPLDEYYRLMAMENKPDGVEYVYKDE